jgi:hypothetical protein
MILEAAVSSGRLTASATLGADPARGPCRAETGKLSRLACTTAAADYL